MTQSIIELARLANIYASNQTNDTHDWQVIRDDRFAQLVRNATLEEAAVVCDVVSADSGGDKYDIFGKDLATQCVDAIRQLKETK